MGKVLFNMSVSLDGFVAGPNHEVDQVFAWYGSGDTEYHFAPGMTFRVSRASAELLQKAATTVGAIVTGKRNFVHTYAWGGHPPLGVHHFVVTHEPDPAWTHAGSPFTFVTDGVASAVAQAKQYAGDKDVAISTATIMRQALKAGVLDEIHLDLVPVLLGKGVRMFEELGIEPVKLEQVAMIAGMGVTHLHYRVVR